MAKRIPPQKIDEIYAAADIVEVVGEFVTLKKRGSNWFGLSPWGNEKTPSFAVSPSKGIFKDFSSGKGGNVVTFLMELEGLTYVEALLQLAKKYSIQIDMEESPEESVRTDHRESLYVLNEFASKFFHKQLLETETGRSIALSYFKERGILESTMETFRLGYSPDEWDALAKEAIKNQFSEEYIVESGLCYKSDKDGRLIDRFRGRVIFPIHDHLGKVAGFGGRILGKAENTAKYINSPETPVYNKSRILYGLYQSRQAIRDKDQCILVEGYMDMVSMYQNGIKNVVASSGTALTEDQIRLIKRYTKNVLLIYDADKAGINAALRGLDLLLEQELAVKVLLLPEGHDPDSFVKEKGKTGFEDYLAAQAADFIDFKIARLLEIHDPKDPQGKTRVIHEAAETIAKIPDPVQQSVYTSLAADKLGISEVVMQGAIRQALNAKAKLDKRNERIHKQTLLPLPGEEPVVKEELAAKDLQEKEILRLLLNYSDKLLLIGEEEVPVIDFILGEMEELTFTSPWLEKFRTEIIENQKKKGSPDLNFFLTHEEQEKASLASELVSIQFDPVSENWAKYNIKVPKIDEDLLAAVEDALDHFKFKKLKELLKEIQSHKGTEMNPEKEEELLQKFKLINELKAEIANKRGIVIHD